MLLKSYTLQQVPVCHHETRFQHSTRHWHAPREKQTSKGVDIHVIVSVWPNRDVRQWAAESVVGHVEIPAVRSTFTTSYERLRDAVALARGRLTATASLRLKHHDGVTYTRACILVPPRPSGKVPPSLL